MRPPWSILGLERTEDVRAIRRAYAAKLKATDVEGDPDAFIRLREALARALDEAARLAARSAVPAEASVRAVEAVPAQNELRAAEAPAFGGVEDEPDPPPPEAQRFVRLEQLLFTVTTREPEPARLVEAVQAILDHPEMAHIEHEASVQRWLAEVLHAAGPRADPVVPMVVERFGWEQTAGQWDQPWLFEALVERDRALRLVDEVSRPGHPFHPAWRDLTSSAPGLGLKRLYLRGKVRRLLGLIRTECPPAEEWLDGRRVALWETTWNDGYDAPTVPKAMGGMIFASLVVMAFSRLISGIGPDAPPAGPPPAVTVLHADGIPADSWQALAPVVGSIIEDDPLGRLQAANPGLFARLESRWRRAREENVQRDRFEEELRELLEEAVGAGLRGGSAELQAEYWTLDRDRLKWLRDESVHGASGCSEGGATFLPASLRDRYRGLQARALLEPPPWAVERSTEGRFTIPASLFASARQRSGLDEETFRRALLDEGSAEARCNARIALIDAALDLRGDERARFLRDMSRSL